MPPVSSDFVRETFLEFFRTRRHTEIRGASVLAKDDPTLLFVNSGMAPLKDYFTGVRTPPSPNLTNVQPCVRTIDIDDIGDRHHLSFFEMMGSWSIGDYWKDRAVELAYELLTEGFGFDPGELYVTVFAGDEALGLHADEESAAAWERVGMPLDHIVGQPAADNFWGPAGTSGPCGPCTEVFLDTGDAYGAPYRPGREFDTQHRYIEIWNAAVCMEFDKGLDGRLSPLPFRSIDTGSGLERVTLALNGYDNVYQTDLLSPVVDAVRHVLDEPGDMQRHHRIIADHVRASVAILAEGVRPSNEGAGYIPRRLLRRAATLALTRGRPRFEFEPVVDAVVERMAPHYPAYGSEHGVIVSAIAAELEEFEGALRRGLTQLDELLADKPEFTGADAYRLWSTFGLPVEIAGELAAARGVPVDLEDVDASRRDHQERSRGDGRGNDARIRPHDPLPASVLSLPATEFVGYEEIEARARALALLGPGVVDGRVEAGQAADLILERTPLYGEGGGQIGDHGRVSSPSGTAIVEDTVVHGSGLYLHHIRVLDGSIETGQSVTVQVDPARRGAAAANHSATHLLNAALRRVLGDHIHQAGSLVSPDRLRFDFTHPKPVTADELDQIERLVNTWVLADLRRRIQVMTPAEAIAAGATSLEGETYPERVRVISFGEVSSELCGGTHVDHTSYLGQFRLASQESVASGVRRITAYTRQAALDLSLDQARTLGAVSAAVHTAPRDVVGAVERLVDRSRGDGAPAGSASARKARAAAVDTGGLDERTIAGVEVAIGPVAGEAGALRPAVAGASKTADRVVVAWTAGDPATLAVAVPSRYQSQVDASRVVKELLAPLGGSGGGSPALAQGGGARPPEVDAVAQALADILA